MDATAAERSIGGSGGTLDAAEPADGASPRRSSVESEADRARRQQQLRRRTQRARQALAAHRTR